MSFDAGDDPLVRMLSSLPVAAPNPSRSAHVRARCHDALARRLKEPRRPAQWSVKMVIVLAAVYAAELTRLAVALLSGTLSTLTRPAP